MVHIKSFRGIRYNKAKVDLMTSITPPNDVISVEEDKELKKSKYSFSHLILPRGNGNKYENAKKLCDRWISEGILIQDDKESIYILSQQYIVNGKKYNRTGFLSLVELEDLGTGVLPHEKVLDTDLKDRTELISVTKANFGVPFVLYDDREKIIDKMLADYVREKDADITYIDKNDIKHSLWRVTDSIIIFELQKEMNKHQCIIADGHHRYTSALKVREMVGEKYGLLCFVNSFNEGMIILPTNRVVFGLDNVDMAFIFNQLRRYFSIEMIDDIRALASKVEKTEIMIDKSKNLKNHVFGMYSNVNDKGYLLRLKDTSLVKGEIDGTDIYRKLDVNILHRIILEKILGITVKQQRMREHVDFIKGNPETVEAMKDKSNQLCFFVNPPLMREVFLTARAGETMPQKSTYFFPKIYSGFVIYRFGGG